LSAGAIEVLYADEALLAVNKPAGLLVHRSAIATDERDFLLERLREQVPGPLHLAHRLDRATSGVVLLARSREVAAALGRQFMERTIDKRYLAVVRGWPQAEGVIDYPLPDVRERGPRKPASTRWRVLATTSVAIALGRYPEQRYALVEASPQTGRYRQIRKHFHHVSHHLIGDTSHGRGDHNRLWRQHFGVHRLLLHARSLAFLHPLSATPLCIEAGLDPAWRDVLVRFGWEAAV
jgi:tRNA pseudouridine65 synthase